MFASAIVPLALAASALANVFITNPISSSTLSAGQNASLTWQDSGDAPSLAQFGNATFAIYVGNAIQQTVLQTIATSINVSAVSSLVFTPDATIGPNSNEYFIRVTSLSYKNPSSSQYFEEAFSAKFTLTGMKGSFNSSVQAEIDGQSTAPIGPTSTPSSGTVSATGSVTGTTSHTVPSTTSASPTTTAKSNGAGKPVMVTGLVALVATFVGISLL